jgi:hypothetical protein
MYSLENGVVTDGIRRADYCCPPIRQNKLQMSATSGLVTELERIATALNADDGSASQFSLASVAEKIAKTLSVRKDEVAIMGVSTRWRHLHFLVPEALKNVGFIPLSSNSALAARTARDSRPEIDNNFIVARHATVFEGVKINSETPESIQKMLSAPILSEGKDQPEGFERGRRRTGLHRRRSRQNSCAVQAARQTAAPHHRRVDLRRQSVHPPFTFGPPIFEPT